MLAAPGVDVARRRRNLAAALPHRKSDVAKLI
jgi:hypothetical protein